MPVDKGENAIPAGYKTFQEFLDKQQYSRNGILAYEKVFGRHFVSTGGRETTEEFVKILKLTSGQKVIDIGCGIGGSAFLHGTGIDLSSNMINIAQERLQEIGDNRVSFAVTDATTKEYPDSSVDVVYSRDAILHIDDKQSLFQRFLKWLKPGGKVLISDYCCKDGEWSKQFTEYVAQRGYHLLSPKNYGKILEEAGFVNVKVTDNSDMFVDILKKEIIKVEAMKEEFIKEFSQEDFDAILTGWKNKVQRPRTIEMDYLLVLTLPMLQIYTEKNANPTRKA